MGSVTDSVKGPKAGQVALGSERGQATVELAVVLPVVLLVLLATLQAGMLVRDRILLISATRVAGRAAIVSPRSESVRDALENQGAARSARVSLTGDKSPGGLVLVTLRMQATRVPVVGHVVSRVELTESLTVRVEGLGQ